MDDFEIRRALRLHQYNISKVSRELGVDYKQLKEEYGTVARGPIVVPSGPPPADIRTLGRPNMQQFVIAIRSNADPHWPVEYFNVISRARRYYDAGTHEMCQEKRRDGWIVLYLIPRREPAVRPPYFRWEMG